MRPSFPWDFSQVAAFQGYFPKCQLAKYAISQAATSQVCPSLIAQPQACSRCGNSPLAHPSWNVQSRASKSGTFLDLKESGGEVIRGVRYFPRGLFPRSNFPRAFSQEPTYQKCNFPSRNFLNVQFHKGQLPICTFSQVLISSNNLLFIL